MNKLTSRKFWVCVAAMLASIATSIAGITTDNQTVLVIGAVCGVVSAAIYAFCEAWVDGKAVNANNMDAIVRLLDDLASSQDEDEKDGE